MFIILVLFSKKVDDLASNNRKVGDS